MTRSKKFAVRGATCPVISYLGALVSRDPYGCTVQPVAAPRVALICPRCGYGEIHLLTEVEL